MAKLIYSMITSLDGYAEAAEGGLGSTACASTSNWSRSAPSPVD